jgi:peptide-methionine (S)-S-oxide reductase
MSGFLDCLKITAYLFLAAALAGPWEALMAQEKAAPGARKPPETVTLGGGCFWCIEAVFDELKGVQKVESGYSGGTVPNPTYKQVCNGETGHAESVQITFDHSVISLKQILEVFFTVHDPTTLNRQGADVGTQYRSAIFYRSEEQKRVAEQVIRELEAEKLYGSKPFVTQVVPFSAFYKAENYHQEYYENNPNQPYCQVVISPKVEKFRKKFKELLKSGGA